MCVVNTGALSYQNKSTETFLLIAKDQKNGNIRRPASISAAKSTPFLSPLMAFSEWRQKKQ